MRGLSFLVTGAAGGLGSILCRTLLAEGATVIAHVRSSEQAGLDLPVRFVIADLSSLAETRALASEVGQVDVLVNNAGVGFGRNQLHREVSHDGLEPRFAVNYLAPYVLTHALMARAKAIIQVASIGQRALDFDDLQCERHYDGIVAYRRSKLAQVMLSFDVADQVPCNALHPGTFLDTPMLRESGITPLGTAQEGAEAIMFAIQQTLAGTTGAFFDQLCVATADPQAYDVEARRRLRERTAELLA